MKKKEYPESEKARLERVATSLRDDGVPCRFL